jgi:hypothetical protein
MMEARQSSASAHSGVELCRDVCVLRAGHRVLLVVMPPVIGDLYKTSQPQGRFWTASRKARSAGVQRAVPPLELRALDGVAGELDRPLIRAGGSHGVARAAEQFGVRRVQRLVALERRIA